MKQTVRRNGFLVALGGYLAMSSAFCAWGASEAPIPVLPPFQIVSPANGAAVSGGASLRISALAVDTADARFARQVRFLANGLEIGVSDLSGSIFPAVLPLLVTHSIIWSNAPAGTYELVATTTRIAGAESVPAKTESIKIVVNPVEPPLVWVETIRKELVEGAVADAFLFRRQGSLRASLPLTVTWSGSASNRVDYSVYPEKVVFRPGSDRVSVAVRGLTDSLVEPDESVVVKIEAPPIPALAGAAEPYRIGEPASGTLLIKDRPPENHRPLVRLDGPNRVVLAAEGTNVFGATATDADGTVVSVAFILNGVRRGLDTNAPFQFVPGPLSAGLNSLYAIATDNRGGTGVSDRVTLEVLPGTELPEVRLETTDGSADEADPTNIMKFTLTRSGGETSKGLRVYLSISGSATQDVDYQLIPAPEFTWCPLCLRPSLPPLGNFVEFPPGIDRVEFGARALPDSLGEGREEVALKVIQPPDTRECAICPPLPPAYRIHSQSAGGGVIEDSPSTGLPVITVTAVNARTVEGDTKAPLTFRVSRQATNFAEPLVVYCNFGGSARFNLDYVAAGLDWAGGTNPSPPLGVELPGPGREVPVSIPAGETFATVQLTALADASREGDESAILGLTYRTPLPWERLARQYEIGRPDEARAVIADGTPTPTNPPVFKGLASWVRPGDRQRFDAPANLRLEVLASANVALVERVEFLANGTNVGVSEFPCAVCDRFLPPGVPLRHGFTWSNVVAGEYILTAVGTVGTNRFSSKALAVTVGPAPELPQITLAVTGAVTSEPNALSLPAPGVFQLRRSGPTNQSVKVYYSVSGTARNGRDYSFLDGDATIAAGAMLRDIRIVPLADKLAEGDESVVLTLRESRAYRLGTPVTGQLILRDGSSTGEPTNPPPVTLVFLSPKAGDRLTEGVMAPLRVVATDPKGYFTEVEFLLDGGKLGDSRLNFFREPDPGTPIEHSLAWTAAKPGSHQLTARGKSSSGAEVSTSVGVVVEPRADEPPAPHPADQAPADYSMTAGETGDYAAAWRVGSIWISGPNPIPIGYVTRAGYLHRSGEAYRRDPQGTLPPQWWVPVGEAVPTAASDFVLARTALLAAEEATPGPATLPARSVANSATAEFPLNPENQAPSPLRIRVTVAAETKAWAIEQVVGAGSVVANLSEGGIFDPAAGVIRWGPYFDTLERTLTADVTRDNALRMTGVASFDGADQRIPQLVPPPPLPLGADEPKLRVAAATAQANGAVQLLIVDALAGGCAVEVTHDLKTWVRLEQLPAGQENSNYLDTDADESPVRFYRVVRP